MTSSEDPFDPQLDLRVTRVIRAPRTRVWEAWSTPSSFEKWWVPAPEVCRVGDMDLRPGGAFRTEISIDGAPFAPHMTGCFLVVDELEKIMFTDALVGGWRPSEQSFVTVRITMADHPEGTLYTATALHRSPDDRARHEELGFHDGWGTVTRQLAKLVEDAA
ncbi:MAG TPA: SRPBCC family protein [Pseudolysinimonas sp.]|nr:SRPBCC family protein [Pseudolysinimonas sp.]